MANCPKCKAPTRDEMKFCPGCGENLFTQAHGDEAPTQNLTDSSSTRAEPELDLPGKGTNTDSDRTTAVVYEEAAPGIKKRQLIFASVLGALAIAGVGVLQGVLLANESAQEDLLERRANQVAEICASTIGQQVDEVKAGEVVRHWTSSASVTVRFQNLDGNQVGDEATCEYFLDEDTNTLYLQRFEWAYERDGVANDVSYSRVTKVVTFEPVKRAPSRAVGAGTTAASCESAFRQAAAVPLSRDNNAEIAQTTKSCSDVDEWWAMLKRYPDTFGVSGFLESEKGLYVGSACTVGAGSPVCRDANLRGIGF